MKKEKLPDGRVRIDYTLNGKRYRETVVDNMAADLRLNEIDRQRIIEKHVNPDNVTIQHCIDKWNHWSDTRRRSPAYRKRCKLSFDRIMPFLEQRGIVKVKNLNKLIIDDYVSFRKNLGRKDQTILNEYRTLNAALNYAYSRDIIPVNPIARYKFDEIVHEVPEVPHPEDLHKIFECLPDIDTQKIFYYILAMGPRYEETSYLEAKNIDSRNGTITYEKAKGGRPYRRTVKLREMPFAFPQSGTLFTLEGRRWVNRTLLQKIEGACMLAGQPRINIHTLRHAHCTFELASSYEQTNIQGLMVRCGWRTLSMVSRYMEKARTFEIKGSYLPPWPSEDKKDQSK